MRLDTVADAVSRGMDALAGGQWQAAREAFEAALAGPSDAPEGVAVAPPDAVTAEAEEGLARALWWLHDFEAAVGHMQRAPSIFAGTSLVEFSPTDRLNETMEVVTKNMEAAGS
jgi:hypothetical protein